jgi:hypothetical protein
VWFEGRVTSLTFGKMRLYSVCIIIDNYITKVSEEYISFLFLKVEAIYSSEISYSSTSRVLISDISLVGEET